MSGKPVQPLYSLRALGKDDLPETITVAGKTWHHETTIKHDFFAATGFYLNDAGQRAVLKIGRVARYAGLPLQFVGRFLCRREMRFYQALQHLPNIPALLGQVGETGFLHAYVDGRPLEKNKPCPDGFFTHLQNLMQELHRQNIAYVDTNKPQNILLGDDGLPHLIDFQISWDLHAGNNFLNRWILHHLQREDLYHILKHKRRIRPDELTEEEQKLAEHKSFFIRVHRVITKPYFFIRRKLFARLRASGRILPEGSK